MDLSGVAKGYATDRVAAYLASQGLDNYLVNIGGELEVAGHRDGEAEPWRIGVEIPRDGRPRAKYVLPLEDTSVATSGDYRNYFEEDGRRYSHTIDPRTGRPIRHRMASVTVVDDSNARADAWATAMSVLGEDEGMALAVEHDLAVMMLVRNAADDDWISLGEPGLRGPLRPRPARGDGHRGDGRAGGRRGGRGALGTRMARFNDGSTRSHDESRRGDTGGRAGDPDAFDPAQGAASPGRPGPWCGT